MTPRNSIQSLRNKPQSIHRTTVGRSGHAVARFAYRIVCQYLYHFWYCIPNTSRFLGNMLSDSVNQVFIGFTYVAPSVFEDLRRFPLEPQQVVKARSPRKTG